MIVALDKEKDVTKVKVTGVLYTLPPLTPWAPN